MQVAFELWAGCEKGRNPVFKHLPRWLSVKNMPANTGDMGLIPGLGRSPGEGNGNLLQYCCLENPMDRGALPSTVHGVAKSQTRLSNLTTPGGGACGNEVRWKEKQER